MGTKRKHPEKTLVTERSAKSHTKAPRQLFSHLDSGKGSTRPLAQLLSAFLTHTIAIMQFNAFSLSLHLVLSFLTSTGSAFSFASSPLLLTSSTLKKTVRERTTKVFSDGADANEAVDKGATEPPILCSNCDLCDGSGRIAGGLAAIPLFSFWPIKAYR